ncbi:MAG: hypothetical protein K1X81_01615 [Bacteroidia bacterium]|nr:hypothetical protein [Bacteroidia bacterium]
MKAKISYLILLLQPILLLGQQKNITEQLLQINKFYAAHSKLSMAAEYRYYHQLKDRIPFSIYKAQLLLNERLSVFSSSQREIVIGKDYYVYADHTDKTIVLAGRNSGTSSFKPDQFLVSFQSLLGQCESSACGKEDSLNYCQLKFGLDELNEIKICYNNSYCIKKIIITGKKLSGDDQMINKDQLISKIEIVYSDINTSPHFAADQFTYSKYLNYSRGNYKPKKPFEQYQVKANYSKNQL